MKLSAKLPASLVSTTGDSAIWIIMRIAAQIAAIQAIALSHLLFFFCPGSMIPIYYISFFKSTKKYRLVVFLSERIYLSFETKEIGLS